MSKTTYDFDPLLQHWAHGSAECLTCGHTWIAVWPLGADALECPDCHGTDTDRIQRVYPPDPFSQE